MGWTRLSLGLLGRALRDPRLVPALVRVAWRFRALDWWHRPPFLPLPEREYMKWRMYTAYGDEHAIPPAEDVARYARWATRKP